MSKISTTTPTVPFYATYPPTTHPTLSKMLAGYVTLQQRRDVKFARSLAGTPTRVFVERATMNIYEYWLALREEIEWVAEMLGNFDGYNALTCVADKAALFSNFWILFTILERSCDTVRVLGVQASEDDRRMVFEHGIIADVLHCEYDMSEVSTMRVGDMGPLCYPWFKHAARELLLPIRRLAPTEVEIMFALGLMFWRLPVDVQAQVNGECARLAEGMVRVLYAELDAYYAAEMPLVNRVERVAELVGMIAITEVEDGSRHNTLTQLQLK